MPWIIISLVALAVIFSVLGWRWERSFQRPITKKKPLVSILIPTYRSKATIKNTLRSIQKLEYINKEVIVVNDSSDSLHTICKQYGATLIQNKKRLGKARALNKAIKKANGEIFFFVDADTVVEKDCLTKIVPWFTKKEIGAVSPKYIVRNKKNLLTRLISLEHSFMASLFKIHMHFGSLIAFRGCGVAIRRSVFNKLGGWPETLIEDVDMGMNLVSKGYTIQYDPEAVVKTDEPTSWSGLKKQRLRWGKGTLFSYLHYYKNYSKNIQFSLYFLPYIFFAISVVVFLLYQTTIYMLPLFSLYLLYTFSIREFVIVSSLLLIPLLATTFTNVATASVTHMALLTAKEKGKFSDLLLSVPYVFAYFPFIMYCYIKGMVAGIRDKRNKKDEISFSDW